MKPAAALARCVLLVCPWLVTAPGAARPADPHGDGLAATVRELEKKISDVRGLAYKTPVIAQVIPRPKDADKHLQGYYSVKDKTLFLYDDLSGAYERGVLIHEMVHALQDQNFGLAKLHQDEGDDDAELAKDALIEGDATFTMIEVLKKDQPKVAAMLEAPLEKVKNLRNAFLYAQGARYVKALKERGGWEAVNNAYRFPPESTADVLHPEGVSTIDLGPGAVVGELGWIQRLMRTPETAPLSVQAASGWIGDRTVEYGGATAHEIAFADRDHAQKFREALAKAVAPREGEFGADCWKEEYGETEAVLTRGSHVLWIKAPGAAAYRLMLDYLEGPPSLAVYSAKDKKTISFGEMVDRLADADIVCLGETHDSVPCHRVQLEIIASLFARDDRLAVGMEMFQRPFQKDIDRYFQGGLDEEEFLKASEYRERWGFNWSLYRPIVDFCRKNGVPLAALNAPRELTRKISKSGYASLTDDEKKQLGDVDFQVKEHRDYWYERLPKMHGQKDATPEQKERGYEVMTVWDDYMATSAAAFQHDRGVRRMVVLAGSGHVERGFGIP
ncbi:MAG TPA: ChaN family lipoprotein, partial [Gemmataceae bacterium]|nr:ChaN family lipoprotein [Gemmataceae bacterium]